MSINSIEDRVLALKYRPKRFEDLIGQTTISQTLSLALDSKRLSHAYLFSGLRGSGKTSTARIMAKALLCSSGPTSSPCDVCENCISANSGKHLDIIEMDAASNRGIDDIKELIEHTKYKPSLAKFKVFIIDEVHMLTTQAFNALLKTLEEPPSFIKFILATTDALKLPATILSRTQHFRFNKISKNEVVNHLSHILNKESIEFEKEALEILARSGQGSLRDTLTLLDQAIIFSKGRVTSSSVIDMLGLIEPNLMENIFKVILNNEDINPLITELQNYEVSQICDEMSIYLKEKMLLKDSRFDIVLFDRFFRIIGEAKQLLALNSDDSFVLILTLMKLKEATNLKSIDEIMNQLEKTSIIEDKISTNQIAKENFIEDTPIESKSNPTSLETNKINAEELYEQLINKIYDRDITLGECFERNFIYNGYENNILNIISYAQDEERKLLYKHFGLIKSFAQDIFGQNIELDFKKEEATLLNKEENTKHEDNFSSSCIENIISSCSPTEAQKELSVNDILNSTMLNRAKELFDIKKITVVSKN